MTAAAIQATFADYKRVKSRKVMQLVFEVPLENWPRDYRVLGEPEIETATWFAIAAMNVSEPAPTPKEQGSKLAANAALTLQEGSFRRYLATLQPPEPDGSVVVDMGNSVADTALKKILGIKSKAELNTDPAAAQRWRDLRGNYEAWLRT